MGFCLFYKTSNLFWFAFTQTWSCFSLSPTTLKIQVSQALDPTFFQLCVSPAQSSWARRMCPWHIPLSNHGKPCKQKDSPLVSGCYKTPSLLVPVFFGKSWRFSYRRSQLRSLCQVLAERLLSPVDVETHFLGWMSSGPDPSLYCSHWLLCEQGERITNHLKEICIVSNRG